MEKEFVIRYTIPTKLDVAPYGTICKVVLDNNQSDLFIQLGATEASWRRVGNFLESVFEDFLHDDGFVEECLRLFNKKASDPFIRIKEILKEKKPKA